LVTPLTVDGAPSLGRDSTMMLALDEVFARSVLDPEWRRLARAVLVGSHFRPAEQVVLCEMLGLDPGGVVRESDRVSEQVAEENRSRGRDARFRQSVVAAYDFTCALTGHRLVTLGAGSLVDAAHIRPVSHGGPCVVANGLALSKSAHWLFDEGLWSVDGEWRVLVAYDRFQERLVPEAAGSLLRDLAGRVLHLPRRREHWPAAEFVAWHARRSGVG
jgi:putative restriction endonuclease